MHWKIKRKLAKLKRKQCKACYRTFYGSRLRTVFLGDMSVDYEECPYCGGEYIIV